MKKIKFLVSAIALLTTLTSCAYLHVYSKEEILSMVENCNLEYFARSIEAYSTSENRAYFYKKDETQEGSYRMYKATKDEVNSNEISFYLRKEPATQLSKIGEYGSEFIEYIHPSNRKLYLFPYNKTIVCWFYLDFDSPIKPPKVALAYQLSSYCFDKIYQIINSTEEDPDDPRAIEGSILIPNW